MGLFGGQKQMKPPVETVVPTTASSNLAQESEMDALARRRGFAANLITGASGLSGKLGQIGGGGAAKLLGG